MTLFSNLSCPRISIVNNTRDPFPLYYTEFHCQRTQNLFFLAFFESVNSLKTFIFEYLNDQTYFLHFKIKVLNTNVRILALEFKNAFNASRARALNFSKPQKKIKILKDRPLRVCLVK